MKTLEEKKEIARSEYKETRKAYLADMSKENWLRFCEAKSKCMRLGVLI
ncbi:hypothetical protein [Ruminococcus callidus]